MNVIHIDNHPIIALGAQKIFEENFKDAKFYYAKNGKEALAKFNEISFKIAILDIVLPKTDTQALLTKIRNLQPKCKILIYSNYQDKIYAMRYISMGASGFLNKSKSEKDFVMAINMILAGQLFISQEIAQHSISSTKGNTNYSNPFEDLSKRELELFNHLIKGEQMSHVCDVMNIQQSTSATLKKRIMTKLSVTNMVELINLAKEYGY